MSAFELCFLAAFLATLLAALWIALYMLSKVGIVSNRATTQESVCTPAPRIDDSQVTVYLDERGRDAFARPISEREQEYRQRRETRRLLANNPRTVRRIRDWSESSGELVNASGSALVARGNDGKLYNMGELTAHMGKIFRSGDQRYNMMMAEVFLLYHTHPSNLIPISLSESEIAQFSEYDAMGRGLALQAGWTQPSVGGNHQAVQYQMSDTCNGLPRR